MTATGWSTCCTASRRAVDHAAAGVRRRGGGRPAGRLLHRRRRGRARRHLRIRLSRRQNRHLLRPARPPRPARTGGRPRPDGPGPHGLGRRLSPARSSSSMSGVSGAGRAGPRCHQLQQVYDATRADGVALLGIDVRDNNRQAAQDFVKDRKVTFPSIYDPAMRTMIAFGGKYPTSVIPSTLVLDRSTGWPRCSCANCSPRTCSRWCSGSPPNPPTAAPRDRNEQASPKPPPPDRFCWRWRCPCWPGWCHSRRRAWCRWCRAICRIWPRWSVSTNQSGPLKRRPPRGGGSPGRRRCSSPGSPWCSCSARSPYWA